MDVDSSQIFTYAGHCLAKISKGRLSLFVDVPRRIVGGPALSMYSSTILARSVQANNFAPVRQSLIIRL